ncbi:MAG: hypothetical protein R3288_06385 [Woeseiaceae bacterium]|nr:hypothetical protein [Woeseiaceae bacterium]
MRRQLIEALTYPRLLVGQLIEQGNYQYKSFYEATGQRCHVCDGKGECQWDKCLGDFSYFREKTTEELSESLREGIKLVEAMISELRHDETKCTCETCNWIRNAEHLTEECEHHLPHVEPDLHHQAHAE